MAAAYQCDISMTDAETLLFNVPLRDVSGDPPTWGDYAFEYALEGCGVSLLLTEGDGITVDETSDLLTIGPEDRTYRLQAGAYKHGLRITETASSVTTQLFDGTVTVTEGNFPA